jgi:hypothetical protein
MEDVLSVYKRPYNDKNPVVAMDEVSKQLTKETRLSLPARSGEVAKYDTEYERNGTANIFLMTEPLTGNVHTKVTERRTCIDWAYFIKDIVLAYPEAEMITLILDNLNTHTGASLYKAFEPAVARMILDKLDIHYTPKHGSWLNVAEIEISHLSRQCLDRRIPNKSKLNNEVQAWTRKRNVEQACVDWQFTAEDARIKLKNLYPIITAKSGQTL